MKPLYQPGGSSAMRNTLMLIVLSGWLLAGCTVPLLQDMNASLKSVNASLRGVNDSLRGTSSVPLATTPATTSDVCDPAAFDSGFKHRYVLYWNWGIHDKEVRYKLESQQHPEDAAAHHNYALYQGKQISGKEVSKAVGYGSEDYNLKLDNQGHILNYCQFNSYMKGERAGIQAAGQDLKALEAQET